MPSPCSKTVANMVARYLIDVGNGMGPVRQLPMPPIVSPLNIAPRMAGIFNGATAFPDAWG
eukprot:3773965-Pyramimonas_sp.AAC.1